MGKMLKGPLIVKTDSGPGWLSSEAESIDFREEMANLGVYILFLAQRHRAPSRVRPDVQ